MARRDDIDPCINLHLRSDKGKIAVHDDPRATAGADRKLLDSSDVEATDGLPGATIDRYDLCGAGNPEWSSDALRCHPHAGSGQEPPPEDRVTGSRVAMTGYLHARVLSTMTLTTGESVAVPVP